MFWADRIAGEATARFGAKPIFIRDEKTLSGRVHIGSFRGLVIHGAVHEALDDKGAANEFVWEHNDFDPFDSIPPQLDEATFKQHLGKPLFAVPSPKPGYENFAEYYAADFVSVHKEAGFTPRYYRAYKDLYKAGKMDGVIRTALERAADIRRILKEVSGSVKDEKWLPISVVCEKCGKIMTTSATDFDGNTVAYVCERNPEGVVSCGHSGRTSPFGGRGKLFWKAEWAGKWKALGVMVEGGGKDHSTKGGSRDVANHISKEVFSYEPPLDIPYEFFLVGGQKMSSSKGRGTSAREVADLLPPKMLRLLMLGKDINQAINFDPEGDTIPVLYDQYDKLAENYWKGEEDDYARLFEFVHPVSTEVSSKRSSGFLSRLFGGQARPFSRKLPSPQSLPRFSQVAFVVQMPHMDIYKEFPQADKKELEERATYAKRWLEAYAPEKYVYKLHDEFPEAARNLDVKQKEAIQALIEFMESNPNASGEELQATLHEFKEFKAIYLAFLAKVSGPKAGWFLAALPREFVLKRLKEAVR